MLFMKFFVVIFYNKYVRRHNVTITAVMKVKTDIITSIEVGRNLQN